MNNDPFPQPVVSPTPSTPPTPPVSPVPPVTPTAPINQPQGPMPIIEPPSSKKPLLLIVGVIALVVVIGGGIFAYINRGVTTLAANGKTIRIANNPLTIENQFMNDLFVGNYKGAYGLTSTGFKSTVSLTAFTTAESTLKVNQLTLSGVKAAPSGKNQLVTGTILIQGDHLFSFASRQVKQSGIWRVDNLALK